MPYSNERSYIRRVQLHRGSVPVNYYFQNEAKDYELPKLLPGHVYTFDYMELLDEAAIPSVPEYHDPEKLKKYTYTKPYYDIKPIGLALGRLGSGHDEYVMNLKAMPTPEAMTVLEVLFRSIHPVIEKFALTKERDLKPIQERLKTFDYVRAFATMNPGFFRQVLGGHVYFWVNKYNVSRVRNVKLIDFDVLEKVTLTNYRNDKFIKLNGNTLQDLHSYYEMHMKK